MSDLLLCVQPFPCPGGHMEKQEKEVKWKLEMEIGSKNGSQKKGPTAGAVRIDKVGIDEVGG